MHIHKEIVTENGIIMVARFWTYITHPIIKVESQYQWNNDHNTTKTNSMQYLKSTSSI